MMSSWMRLKAAGHLKLVRQMVGSSWGTNDYTLKVLDLEGFFDICHKILIHPQIVRSILTTRGQKTVSWFMLIKTE